MLSFLAELTHCWALRFAAPPLAVLRHDKGDASARVHGPAYFIHSLLWRDTGRHAEHQAARKC